MRRLFLFLLLFLEVPTAWPNLLVPYVALYGGEYYQAFVIVPNYYLNDFVFGDKAKALFHAGVGLTEDIDELLGLAEKWILQTYEKEGMLIEGKSGERMRRSLQVLESNRDGRSAVVLITDIKNRRDVRGLFRVDTPTDENSLLPLEARLLHRGLEEPLPRQSPRWNYEIQPNLLLKTQQPLEFGVGWWKGTVGGWDGAPGELKCLGNPKGPDLLPLMYLLAETHKLTLYSGLTDASGRHGIYISDYWAEADTLLPSHRLVCRYYRRKGFQTFGGPIPNPDMPPSKTQIWRMSRKKWKSHVEKTLFTRAPPGALNAARFSYHPDYENSCEARLEAYASRLPFP